MQVNSTDSFTPTTAPPDRTKAADQKYCYACGNLLHVSAHDCPGCGAVQAALPGAATPSSDLLVPARQTLPQAAPNLVFCRGCGKSIHETAVTCPQCGAPQGRSGVHTGSHKSRSTAIILAFLIGGLGGHRFYLGNVFLGLAYLFFCWTFIPAIVAFVEAIYFITLSDEEFSRKY